MADFEITADGLSALNAAIISAAEDALPDTRKALQVNAQKVRDDARRFASGLRHAPLYPYAITYDTRVGVGWAEAVIGRPDVLDILASLIDKSLVRPASDSHADDGALRVETARR